MWINSGTPNSDRAGPLIHLNEPIRQGSQNDTPNGERLVKHLASVIVGALLASSQTAFAADRVTVDNFERVETDFYFKLRAEAGCLGVLCHDRGPKPVDKQDIVRLNRDTPYSGGVFDLNSPVTIELPEAGARFRSLVVINEDHYIKLVSYSAGKITLTRDKIGTRYAAVAIRTFMDPNSSSDLEAGRKLQDAIKVTQPDRGKLELPDWNQAQRKSLHDALLGLMPFVPDSRRVFGDKGEVDEVRHYTARLYRPRAEVLDGKWKFPEAQLVN
jgi:hypothetical protein